MSDAKGRGEQSADDFSDLDDLLQDDGQGAADDDFLADLDAILEEDDDTAAAEKGGADATDLDDLEAFLDDFEKSLEEGDDAKPEPKAAAPEPEPEAEPEPDAGGDDLLADFGADEPDAAASDAGADDGLGDLDDLFAGDDEEAPAAVDADAASGDDLGDFDELFGGDEDEASGAAAEGQGDDALADLGADDFDLSFDEEPDEDKAPAAAAEPAAADDDGAGLDDFEELHILDENGADAAADDLFEEPLAGAGDTLADDDSPFLENEVEEEPSLDFDDVAPVAAAAAAAAPAAAAAASSLNEKPATITPIERPAAAAESAGVGRGAFVAALVLALVGVLGAGAAGYLAYGLSAEVQQLRQGLAAAQQPAPMPPQAMMDNAAVTELGNRVEQLEMVLDGPMSHLRASNERILGELSERLGSLEQAVTELREQPQPTRVAAAPAAAQPVAAVAKPAAARPPARQNAPQPAAGSWSVNLASLSDPKIAAQELQRMRAAGINAEQQVAEQNGKTWYRLRVTGFADYDAAKAYAGKVRRSPLVASTWIVQE